MSHIIIWKKYKFDATTQISNILFKGIRIITIQLKNRKYIQNKSSKFKVQVQSSKAKVQVPFSMLERQMTSPDRTTYSQYIIAM